MKKLKEKLTSENISEASDLVATVLHLNAQKSCPNFFENVHKEKPADIKKAKHGSFIE